MKIEEACPKCRIMNEFDIGDIEDLTVPDPEVSECYSCGHKWLDEDIDECYGYTLENGIIIKGEEVKR